MSGDMRHCTAHCGLEPASQGGSRGTTVRCSSVLEPSFYLPPFVGIPVMQATEPFPKNARIYCSGTPADRSAVPSRVTSVFR